MDILVDTHMALWFIDGSSSMPPAVLDLMQDPRNTVYVSDVSVWEVAIKHQKHPDAMPADAERFIDSCNRARFVFLPLTHAAIIEYSKLDTSKAEGIHNDPFDRLLIAQAKAGNLLLVTHDAAFKLYGEPLVAVY